MRWIQHGAVLFSLLIAGMVIPGACAKKNPLEDKNVILLLIDTLRRDRIGAYGYDRSTSACLDQLAAEGFCFRRAIAPSSWTKPSVASLFTSLYPARHYAFGDPLEKDRLVLSLDRDHITLAESLKKAGYRTAAFITNPHIIPQYHFDQGFDVFIQPAGNAEKLLSQALQWIEEKRGENKFFLYLHVIDPHLPYDPPDTYRDKYKRGNPGTGAVFVREGIPLGIIQWANQFSRWKPKAPDDRFQFNYQPLIEFLDQGMPGIDSETVRKRMYLDFNGLDDPDLVRRAEYLASLYDGEVAYTDDALNRFMEGLKSKGLYEQTILVVTGDHGEAFLEHGTWGHGRDLHAEKIDIPLLFRVPGRDGTILGSSDIPASLVDIYPTVLDMLGLQSPSDLDGHSLWPLILDEEEVFPTSRIVFSEFVDKEVDHVAAVLDTRKLIRTSRPKGEITWLYYDLASDPKEEKPLLQSQGDETLQQLRNAIESLVQFRLSDKMHDREDIRLSDEMVKQLKALGY